MSTPDDRISIDAHDANMTRHFVGPMGAKFRIVVRINSYYNQSHMTLDRWDGGKWQLVTGLHSTAVTTWNEANSARIRKTFTADVIDDDIETLMNEASFITDGFK